jgi:drug/metabolite transporter (DMT)-like permease
MCEADIEMLVVSMCEIGQVIIDSQPLTVAVLAALLFGESLGPVAILGLGLGVVGLVLLEVFLHVFFTALFNNMLGSSFCECCTWQNH